MNSFGDRNLGLKDFPYKTEMAGERPEGKKIDTLDVSLNVIHVLNQHSDSQPVFQFLLYGTESRFGSSSLTERKEI